MENAKVTKLRQLLQENLKGADARIDPPSPTGRIGGTVIWDGFEGMDQLDRQNSIWKIIDDNMDQEERRGILLLLTLTPQELATIEEEA